MAIRCLVEGGETIDLTQSALASGSEKVGMRLSVGAHAHCLSLMSVVALSSSDPVLFSAMKRPLPMLEVSVSRSTASHDVFAF